VELLEPIGAAALHISAIDQFKQSNCSADRTDRTGLSHQAALRGKHTAIKQRCEQGALPTKKHEQNEQSAEDELSTAAPLQKLQHIGSVELIK